MKQVCSHKAVLAGLALSLSLGTMAAPSLAHAQDSTSTDPTEASTEALLAEAGGTDVPESEGAAVPTTGDQSLDRDGVYEDDQATGLFSLLTASASAQTRAGGLSRVSVSAEMKYFAEYESGRNYDQGFSYYDGYNALGYYQFDRRYSLTDFIQQVYTYNPTKYSMFKQVVARKSEVKTGTIASGGKLTALGTLVNDAWHAAYAADPAEFSALQDAFAYNEYCAPTVKWVKSRFGIDLTKRADCVRGLAWSLANLFGYGGAQDFWIMADVDDSMSDRELVSAVCDALIDYMENKSTNQYAASYANRYKKEKQVCLGYIAEDEKEAAGSQKPVEPVEPETPAEPEAPVEPEKPSQPTEPEAPGTGGGESGSESGSGSGSESGKDDAGSGDSGSNSGKDDTENGGSGSDSGSDSGKDDAGSEDTGGSEGDSDSGNDDADKDDGSNDSDPGSGDDSGKDDSGNDDNGGAGSNAGTGNNSGSTGGNTGTGDNASTKRTVRFKVQGRVTQTLEVESGTLLTVPAETPEASGYTFVGWYVMGDNGEAAPFDFGTAVTTDLELVAYFQKNVTVSEKQEDGETSEHVEVDEKSVPTALPQTGDNNGLALLAGTGLAVVGLSVAALGYEHQKRMGGLA